MCCLDFVTVDYPRERERERERQRDREQQQQQDEDEGRRVVVVNVAIIENLKHIFRFSKQINKRQKVDDELAKKFCDNKLKKKKKSKLHLQLIDRSLQFVKYANANATETKKIDFRKVAAQFIILLFTWSIPGIFFVCFRSFSKNNTIVHNYPVRI